MLYIALQTGPSPVCRRHDFVSDRVDQVTGWIRHAAESVVTADQDMGNCAFNKLNAAKVNTIDAALYQLNAISKKIIVKP